MRRKRDRKSHRLFGGTVSAVLVVGVCLAIQMGVISVIRMLWEFSGESMGIGTIIMLLPLVAVVVGVLIALVQRWKEVKSGEEDDARKY